MSVPSVWQIRNLHRKEKRDADKAMITTLFREVQRLNNELDSWRKWWYGPEELPTLGEFEDIDMSIVEKMDQSYVAPPEVLMTRTPLTSCAAPFIKLPVCRQVPSTPPRVIPPPVVNISPQKISARLAQDDEVAKPVIAPSIDSVVLSMVTNPGASVKEDPQGLSQSSENLQDESTQQDRSIVLDEVALLSGSVKEDLRDPSQYSDPSQDQSAQGEMSMAAGAVTLQSGPVNVPASKLVFAEPPPLPDRGVVPPYLADVAKIWPRHSIDRIIKNLRAARAVRSGAYDPCASEWEERMKHVNLKHLYGAIMRAMAFEQESDVDNFIDNILRQDSQMRTSE